MPEIRIDDLGIATVADPDASLPGYLLQTLRLAIAPGGAQQLAAQLDRPLRDVDIAQVRGGLLVKENAGVGNGALEWNVSGGANAALEVWNEPGATVLGAQKFGPKSDLTVPAKGAYVSFSLRGQVTGGPSAASGDLTFGVTAGASIEAAYYHPLSANTTLKDGLSAGLSGFVLPGDLEDLGKLPTKAAASVRGSGKIKFSVSGSLSTVANPLAVNIPAIDRPLGVKAGASVGFEAAAAYFGEYEIRVVGLSKRRVSLGLYRGAGASFDISISASAGVSAGIGGTDLASAIIGALAGKPKLDRDFFLQAGLSDERIDDLQSTVKAAVDRKLAASLELGFGGLSAGGPAFLFTIDLDALDAASSRAVRQALDGDFRAITAADDFAGVRLERSIAHDSVKQSSRLRLNLFGIFNYDSLFEMLRKGREVYDPASGEIFFLDEATANRRQSWIDNTRQISSERVARLMADTVLISLSFAASAESKESLSVEHWYFEYQRKANAGALKDHFDAAAALGLEADDTAEQLRKARFGRLALLAETSYDGPTARGIFLDAGGKARSRSYFETAGRRAVTLLEGGDDADAARAILGSDDEVFGAISVAGSHQAAMAELSKVRIGGESIPVTVREAIYADYLAIAWWADAMSALAAKLSQLNALRQTLPGNVTPDAVNAFRKQRKELQDCLAGVVSRTKPMFGEPWGLVALFLASGGRAAAHVRITSDEFQFERSRGWS